MIEAIIFDMDDVLINTELTKAKAFGRALRKYDVHNGDVWYRRNIGIRGDELAKKAVEEFKITDVTPEELYKYERKIYGEISQQPVAIQTTIDFLKSIPSRIKKGIASSEWKHNRLPLAHPGIL